MCRTRTKPRTSRTLNPSDFKAAFCRRTYPNENRLEGTLISILVVAEKPSVAMSYAKVLGATNRQDGYLEGNGYLVSWCVGHLVELAPPNIYDAKYVKWHLANRGLTPDEIAEEMKLPASLASQFNCRGYYGTLSHNVKAQYDLYFGWFDGNPAHLNPLPPSELGAKYVEAIGGADKVLEVAKASYAKGEYRWVATLLDNLVFAEPENKEARQLLSDTYSQLGYQAESGPWRNFYLTGAQDLLKKAVPYTSKLINDGVLSQMDMGTLLDYCAIQLNGA